MERSPLPYASLHRDAMVPSLGDHMEETQEGYSFEDNYPRFRVSYARDEPLEIGCHLPPKIAKERFSIRDLPDYSSRFVQQSISSE
jgi:hypothetical protein